MSPFGLNGVPEDFSPQAWINKFDSRVKRTLFSIANKAWGRHWSPGIAFKLPGYYGCLALHKGWMTRIKNKDQHTRQLFSNLLMQFPLRRTSFETCIDVIVAFGGAAYDPMSDWFKKLPQLQQLNITWLFGESDFFKRGPADELIEKGVLRNSTVFDIPGAGHHPYIDNPDASVNFIISNIISCEK